MSRSRQVPPGAAPRREEGRRARAGRPAAEELAPPQPHFRPRFATAAATVVSATAADAANIEPTRLGIDRSPSSPPSARLHAAGSGSA